MCNWTQQIVPQCGITVCRPVIGLCALWLFVVPFGCNGKTEGSKSSETGSEILAGQKSGSQNDAHKKRPRKPQPDDWFEDVTQKSGVNFTYHSGRDGKHFTFLESVGGGVSLIDYDRDGDLDLLFPGGGSISGSNVTVRGRPSALYRNDGNFKFVDVTEEAGLAHAGDYSHACAIGDFDGDGWPDFFVTCYGRSRLYRNEQGHFREVTLQSGLLVDGWSTAAVWADADCDGWPDLYVVGYVNWKPDPKEICGDQKNNRRDVCPPQRYSAAPDRLFRNCGDGTFEEITQQVGLKENGKGLGVLAADTDGDGFVDYFVPNDSVPNHFYSGTSNGKFDEIGELAGVALNEFGAAEGSMGVDFGDFNGDGRGDLWVTNFELEDNSLYQSLGKQLYRHATVTARLGGRNRQYVGFGTGLVDFDGDGWLDLFVLNGHVLYHTGKGPYRQPAFIYRNVDGQHFVNVTNKAGPWFGLSHAARGAAAGDLDNDGDLDLVIVSQDAPVTILRNRRTPSNWIRVQLIGPARQAQTVGAVVSMTYQGRKIVRHIHTGAGYLSHFDSRLLFPVEQQTKQVEVRIRWPNGKIELFRNLRIRTTNVLVPGTGESVREN